jgi:hypothetical protein
MRGISAIPRLVEGMVRGMKHALLFRLGFDSKIPLPKGSGLEPYAGAKLAKSLIFPHEFEFAKHSSLVGLRILMPWELRTLVLQHRLPCFPTHLINSCEERREVWLPNVEDEAERKDISYSKSNNSRKDCDYYSDKPTFRHRHSPRRVRLS